MININKEIIEVEGENVIKVNNDKNITLFGQDLIDIILKADQSLGELKKYFLILKLTILSLKDSFSFVAFFNPHSMVNTSKIELCKFFSLT